MYKTPQPNQSHKLKAFDSKAKSPAVNEFEPRPKVGMPPNVGDYKLE